MSEIKLAAVIDRLVAADEAFVAETPERVTLSQLSLPSANELRALISQAGLIALVYDGANEDWSSLDLVEAYAPYRITFAKPAVSASELLVLTNTAFSAFLRTENPAAVWRIALLGASIFTEGRTYTSWADKASAPLAVRKKSPRSLVREASGNRIVPPTVAPWTLVDSSFVPQSAAAVLWANASIAACMRSLADDIDSESGELKFKGPPRLTFKLHDQPNKYFDELGSDGFAALHLATAWVFENEREAEVRHILFACEIARSNGAGDSELLLFGRNIMPALDGAKIAYQMSISEVGKDTLKSLADLRKSVTEDTSKVTEGTRQVAAAVAGALALGFGLIAARLSTSTPRWLLITVMVIVVLYVTAIIFSGYDFIRLQRNIRRQWQSRLYRFLPPEEYKSMVATPTAHAERTFKITACVGGVAVALLAVAIFCDWAAAASATASTDANTEAPVEAGGKAKVQVPAAANAHTSLPISTGAAKQELEKQASSAAAQEGKEKAQTVPSTAKP
ncbi:hypothetical protein NHH73_22620 [Oxalobacteraceae bacterium OTU3CINTB1]|nr:hypothetical protein NHH73_22620 [Oxalobacteraceae bacterium OTU3CINTB1]